MGARMVSAMRGGTWDIHWLDEIDSTNSYVRDQARQGVPGGLVAVADHQTAGRGRLDRRWESPPGANLLASVLLRPGCGAGDIHLCSGAVALAGADA
jgi:BirA family biotin operon repressor/biotin-[acetyl-CoA-carboxylase] ligase